MNTKLFIPAVPAYETQKLSSELESVYGHTILDPVPRPKSKKVTRKYVHISSTSRDTTAHVRPTSFSIPTSPINDVIGVRVIECSFPDSATYKASRVMGVRVNDFRNVDMNGMYATAVASTVGDGTNRVLSGSTLKNIQVEYHDGAPLTKVTRWDIRLIDDTGSEVSGAAGGDVVSLLLEVLVAEPQHQVSHTLLRGE